MVGHVIKSCKSRRAAQKIWPRDHKTMGEFIDEKLTKLTMTFRLI